MSRNRQVIVAALVVAILVILAALVMSLSSEKTSPGPRRSDVQQAGMDETGADTGETVEQSAESERQDGTDGLPDAGATTEASSSEGQPREEDLELQREAETFIEELTESSDEPLILERLDTFVASDRPLVTGARQPQTVEATGAAGPEESQEQTVDAATDAGGRDADAARGATEAAEVAVPEESQEQIPADAVTDAGGRDADAARGATEAAEAEEGKTSASVGAGETELALVDLPLSEDAPVTIAELLEAEEVIPSHAVFYVHTVQPEDDQGIWGIVHDGITENFARGVAMRRGGSTETYRVDIPKDADEIQERDNSSSFLGRLIYDKTQRSWVYNLQTNRVGKNPHMIMPGQEIVIVSFTPEELIAIYRHFAQQGEGE